MEGLLMKKLLVISALFGAVAINNLGAMDQELKQSQQRTHRFIDLLCCLNIHNVPTDLDSVIINSIVLVHMAPLMASLNTLNTNTQVSFFCKSLLTFCNEVVKPENSFMLSDQELGDLLASLLKKKNISLLTFVTNPNSGNYSVLFLLVRYAKPQTNPALIKAIRIVLAAAGDQVNDLAKLKSSCGNSVLYVAVVNKLPAIVQILLDTPGINTYELIMLSGYDGRTPYDIARESGNDKIIALIKSLI